MIDREACGGCYDDHYNIAGNSSTGRCWAAKTGRMMTRYRLHYMQVPTAPGAYTEVRAPSCYHQVNRNVFHNSLPSFVKLADVVRMARAKREAARP